MSPHLSKLRNHNSITKENSSGRASTVPLFQTKAGRAHLQGFEMKRIPQVTVL